MFAIDQVFGDPLKVKICMVLTNRVSCQLFLQMDSPLLTKLETPQRQQQQLLPAVVVRLGLAQCHLLGDLLTGDSVKMPQKMFSYMYEVNFPKFDINANSVENVPRTAATREKSARDRTKLRRSKSTHCMDKMDIKMRPKSHRFRREKEFYNCYNEVKIIDMEDDTCSNNFSAWCVSFDSEADRVSCEFCPGPAAD